MKGHLTSDEISRWLVEGPTPELEEHLWRCASCRTMLAEARAPLSIFRSAVIAWSEDQAARPVRQSAPWAGLRERMHFMNWVPAFGVAAAVAVLAVFLVRTPVAPKAPAQAEVQISSAEQDAKLMDQVDAEVSETVPDAMTPLTDLVAWDSGEASVEKTVTTKHQAKGKASAVRTSVTD
jgi:predicted anti-sigma-YlaC factor YlaD